MTDLKIGDVVPYKNTRGNTAYAKITSFTEPLPGKKWFYGIDVKTSAKVYYPVPISKGMSPEEKVANAWLKVLQSYGVRNIKQIKFDGSWFQILFETEKAAKAALECKLLVDYQYDKMSRMYKYRHCLIGLSYEITV